MEEEKKVSPVWFAIAVVMAVFFLLNVVMAVIWVLLPDDLCFPPFSAHEAALRAARYRLQGYARQEYIAQSYYSLRSVYVDGSRARQVTVFNGYVETDEDFDAWAYWATDSEETLGNHAYRQLQSQSQLRTAQSQGQFQYYRQNDLPSNASTAAAGSASSSREYGCRRNERAQLPSANAATGARTQAARIAMGLSEYNPEPRMEPSPDGAPPRYSQLPREVNFNMRPRVYPYPQTPAPVRTWGHGSAATIRPVVEDHRREAGASQPRGYVKPKAESIGENDSD
ncbi:hypothetical protein J3F83DRAFT_768505 [Trichoderma novae-zelandiae]